jgi:type VI secretion system protein ImpF
MARRDEEVTLRPSVLDRLMEGRGGHDTVSLSQSVEVVKGAILRDLEWLLNTRRTIHEAGDDFPEVQKSVYHFGLADLSSESADSSLTRRKLARRVEDLVRIFEPRLTQVRVTIPEDATREGRLVHFLVEGALDVEPEPKPVAFDTVLEVNSGEFSVAGTDRG